MVVADEIQQLFALLDALRAAEELEQNDERRALWRQAFGALERLRLASEEPHWAQRLWLQLLPAEQRECFERACAGDAAAQAEIERFCRESLMPQGPNAALVAAVEQAVRELGGQAQPPWEEALNGAVRRRLQAEEALRNELAHVLATTAEALDALQPALESEEAQKLARIEAVLRAPLPADPKQAQRLLSEAHRSMRSLAEAMRRSVQRLQRALAEQRSALQRLQKRLSKAEEEARRDPLTGVANRRAFAQAAAAREQEPYALLLLDLDHFKKINDTYGHEAGDLALVQVARALQRRLRTGDLVARIGGEEFVVLLAGVGLQDAMRVAEELRRRIKQLRCETEAGSFACTVSVGVAWHRPGQTLAQVLRAADRALYAAKRKGRDRVQQAE